MQDEMDANIEEIKGDIKTNQAKLEAMQAKTDANVKEMKAKMDIHQEKIEATIHSIRSELEETIKYRVEDVLSCVNQKRQGIRKELAGKTDKT
jgi:hypothetical protein